MAIPLNRVYIHQEHDDKTEETLLRAVRIYTNTTVPFNLSLPEDVSHLKVRISGVDTETLYRRG